MKNKVFFLDRDGVINVDHGYVGSIERFQFIDGVFDACKLILSRGYKIVIITNQAGIGRGLYTENDFNLLTAWMLNEFKNNEIDILGVYHCPHHPEKALEEFKIICDCRKPAPGLILRASKDNSIDLINSVLVGDKESDLESGYRAGLVNCYLVKSEYINNEHAEVFYSLFDAVKVYFNRVTLF